MTLGAGESAIAADVSRLGEQIRGGSTRALARGLTWIEAGGARAETLSAYLYASGGRAHVVGITGSPGSGKSTLARGLARAARARGLTLGIIAVDPSSPFTGGAILGDRIRMNDLALDPGVFIRSMATRGALGGLCRAAADAVDLMDAAGRDLVLVETVGIGQDEVDVMRVAHSVIVVSVPGLGDDIQALKAGVLEIADIHVVNKADRDGANRTIADLRAMLTLVPAPPDAWMPPVLPTVAAREEGVDAVLDTLAGHMAALKTSSELERRRARIAEGRVMKIAQDLAAQAIVSPGSAEAGRLLEQVARRELPPHACARTLLAWSIDASARGGTHDV